jgi:hypothetical protein
MRHCVMKPATASLLACLLLAAGSATLGCGGPDLADRVGAMNDSNIKRVANLYMAYQFRKGMKGPADEAAFKNFIQSEMAPRKLELMRVDRNNVEGLFKSERDGEPFRVRYGLSGGPSTVLAVAFEQTGQDGKRLVAFTDGSVEEVDGARYSQLLEDRGATTPSTSKSNQSGEPAA